jgi:hypothetical protein
MVWTYLTAYRIVKFQAVDVIVELPYQEIIHGFYFVAQEAV